MSVDILMNYFSGSTTYPFIHEVLGQQAENLQEQVITSKAVIAPPSEGGQISQEVSFHPAAGDREGWGQND